MRGPLGDQGGGGDVVAPGRVQGRAGSHHEPANN